MEEGEEGGEQRSRYATDALMVSLMWNLPLYEIVSSAPASTLHRGRRREQRGRRVGCCGGRRRMKTVLSLSSLVTLLELE